jgi:hypothetical protein
MPIVQNNMIELRWYLMNSPHGEVKILQYRQMLRDMVSGEYSWLPWTDVPEYREVFSS